MAIDDTLAINAYVSPSCHPMSLRPEGVALGDTDPAYLGAVSALNTTYQVLSDMSDANRAAHDENAVRNVQAQQIAKRTGTQVPGSYFDEKLGRIVIPLDPGLAQNLNDACHDAFKNRLGPQLDNARKVVQTRIVTAGDEIAKALRDPRGSSSEAIEYGRDVRAHIKSLAPGQRASFVRDAIDAGNVKIVAAVLGTEPFLSGMDVKALEALRALAETKFAPVATKALSALKSLEAKLYTAGGAAVTHLTKSVVPIREKTTLTFAAMNKLRAKAV